MNILRIYKALNDKQKSSVNSVVFKEQNTLVVAGPGSGKTRIISVTAGMLYGKNLNVACLSFSNDAAKAIKDQLDQMDVFESEGLFVGTVHEFCLRFIIRPFAPILGDEKFVKYGIASKLQMTAIEEQFKPRNLGFDRSITRIRRDVVENGIESIAKEEYLFLKAYDAEMENQNLVDFEIIIQKAVEYIQLHSLVRDYIEYQFPWIVIDEYQDMGGSLHKLVLLLLQKTKVRFLAVGDVNQMIYHFLGTKPEFLNELEKQGFKVIRTEICYRFGTGLIEASKTIIQSHDDYIASNSEQNSGICYRHSKGDNEQISYILNELIPFLSKNAIGDEFNRIAILCRSSQHRRIKFYQNIHKAFLNYNINKYNYPISPERNIFENLPDSPFVNWLRDCSGWSPNAKVEIVSELQNYATYYKDLLTESGQLISDNETYDLEIKFMQILKSLNAKEMTVGEWLTQFCTELDLVNLLEQMGNQTGNLLEIDYIQNSHSIYSKSITEFNKNTAPKGVVLTTIHAAKGREFDYVILPGIQNNVSPNGNAIGDNNLLYVACTRAKSFVYVLSNHPRNDLPKYLRDIPNMRFIN